MNSLRISSVGRKGRAGLLALLAALTVLASVGSLAFGAVPIPPGEVVAALLGRGSGAAASIVLYARLPRLCGCLLAGAALACAGVIIQGVLSNPLAAPNVIGVNSGAGLATALCCALAPGAVRWTPIAAFLGALAGVLLVLLEPPHAVRDAVIARASPNANTFFMDILLLHFVSYKSTGR